MSVSLPPVDGVVLADGVDALPGRLRKRLDGAVAKVAGWDVTVDGSEWTVRVDESTVVTLRAVDGAVRTADDARCTCLLAPACLHRAAVLAAAPLADETSAATEDATPIAETATDPPSPEPAEGASAPHPAGANTDGTGTGGTDAGGAGADSSPAAGVAVGVSVVQRAAAEGVWSAASAVLTAGVTGSGAVLRAALLRAAHEARAHGLHRLAAGARLVAARLQDARSGAPHYRLALLADDLRELLLVAHRLRDPALPAADTAALLGTARREYTRQGSLRLHGLCTVPVLARSGHAGTATYTADRDGVLWLVADIYPGDVRRAAATVDAAIGVGEGLFSHRELARTGLVVTDATASESRQLGTGKSVRAVRAGGVAWTDEPLAALWDEPVDSQLDRAFVALRLSVQDRPTGDDLLFLRVEVVGAGDGGVLALTADGRLVTLVAALDHVALAYRDNLRVLAAAAGVPLRLVGRPDPSHPGRVQALALAPDDPAPSEDDSPALRLPASWGGHADLGYDRLHRSMITGPSSEASPEHTPTAPAPAEPPATPDEGTPSAADPGLRLFRRHLDRAVDGGRAVQAFARPDQHLLRRARWDTGADLLAALEAAAKPGARDTFGRLSDDDGRRFVLAWLAAAVYEQAATWALSRAAWSPGRAES